jgi:hypothetical protein
MQRRRISYVQEKQFVQPKVLEAILSDGSKAFGYAHVLSDDHLVGLVNFI